MGVVLLVGPSGCGKTHLARGSGLPVVGLDDFYRDGTDAGMPRMADGVIDWEDPASWDLRAAVTALTSLCRDGSVEMPTYAFGEDRVTGHHRIDLGDAAVVVAEGIFAGELIDRLRKNGLLIDALLIRQRRAVTFARRLLRDLKEGRKSRWYLIRQGWAKTAAEPAVLTRQRAQGARPTSKPAARRRLAALAGARRDPAPAAGSRSPGEARATASSRSTSSTVPAGQTTPRATTERVADRAVGVAAARLHRGSAATTCGTCPGPGISLRRR